MRHRTALRPRRGFTIVELLIVIAIMLILIALAAGLSPKAMASKRMFQATNTVSGALMMAKQRAKRDRLPTGIRLVPTAVGNPYIQTIYLIQQPDDLVGNNDATGASVTLTSRASGTPANTKLYPDAMNPITGQPLMILNGGPGQTVSFSANANFLGAGSGARALVQQGDWLVVNGGGMPHRIVNPIGNNTLTLQINPDVACYIGTADTTNWRIIRQPRSLIGEVPMFLIQNIAIDITPMQPGSPPYNMSIPSSMNVPYDTVTQYMDILFSPGGALLATGNQPINPNPPGDSNIYLYIRDTTQSTNFNGEPAIVTVFSRSGFVKSSPVDQPPDPNPFSFAQDARGSGQ